LSRRCLKEPAWSCSANSRVNKEESLLWIMGWPRRLSAHHHDPVWTGLEGWPTYCWPLLRLNTC
jgi:hypothetical protein